MKTFEDFLISEAAALKNEKITQAKGSVNWSSPSNIAIVKYWGKRPGQIPANASISMTLTEAVTKTKIDFSYSEQTKGPMIDFTFEGESNKDFSSRIEKYLLEIERFLPWIKHIQLSIKSENNFPHSSGIASSASSMSALAVGICEIEKMIYGKDMTKDFFKKASFLARLGSGSASRSLYGNLVVWGMTACRSESSDEYATPISDIHENFIGMRDSILIIESGKKQVSSSFGHDLMKSNPYAKLRFEAAEENMQRLCGIISSGDMKKFIDIMENEALSLHAMMMTSSPGFLLMKPNTVAAIEDIREFRLKTGLSIGFTLDAGANLHVIYPENQSAKIRAFIDSDLKQYCDSGRIIHDKMGAGPLNLSS
jgi:diphosphomevalonate decarboxylase